MSIIGILSEALQAAGAGLTLSSTLETSYGEHAGAADYACIVLGTALWGAGLYLARREYKRKIADEANGLLDEDELPTEKLSIRAMKTALTYGAGFTVISSVTKWAKGIDATSKNTEFLFSGIMDLLALLELNRARSADKLAVIPHERARFLMTFVSDLFLIGSLKHFMDKDIDISDIAVGCVSAALFIGEAIYGLRHDENVSLVTTLLRRLMKLALPTGIVFLAEDLLDGNTSKYAMSDDAFLILNGTLLASVLWMMKKIGIDLQIEREKDANLEYNPPTMRDIIVSPRVLVQPSYLPQHSVFGVYSSFDAGRVPMGIPSNSNDVTVKSTVPSGPASETVHSGP